MTTITDKLTLPTFIRAAVEKAIEAAKNPRGMSTHDGKATIGHDKLAYLLAVIDAYASQQAAPMLNGLTEAETAQTASVAGLVNREPSDARVEAYTSEQHFALREAYCIAAGDAYFEARPFAPGDPRITFDAGFVRGFDKATDLADARAVLQAADAVSAGTPDGYVLVPEKATPLIREALRIGMRREVPNDDLCDIRWRAAIAAAQGSVKEAGNG